MAQGCDCKGFQAELKLTNKYAARFGMDEHDQHHSYSRHSGNTYMMQGNNMQSNYMRMQQENQESHEQNPMHYRSNVSGGSYISRHVAYQAPNIQTINSGGNIEQQSSVSAAVIMRGVPSQEIRYEDQQPQKREEKESHYSKHVTSNTSFGGLNNAKSIFGKQMMDQVQNEDEMVQSELQREHQTTEIRTYVAA